MNRAPHTVRVDEGKYTFISGRVPGAIEILRHGECWHAQSEASNALHSLMCELDAARVVLQAVRKFVAETESSDGPMARALRLHKALTDDQEKPSDWCEVQP